MENKDVLTEALKSQLKPIEYAFPKPIKPPKKCNICLGFEMRHVKPYKHLHIYLGKPTQIAKYSTTARLVDRKHKKRQKLPINELLFSKRKQTGRIPSYIKWGSKFHNTPSQYKGRMYHSKKESEYAMILDDMVENEEIEAWLPQYTLKLDVNGKHICNYIADFLVSKESGEEIHETKGFFTDLAKLKWKLAIALYPQYKFKLIK